VAFQVLRMVWEIEESNSERENIVEECRKVSPTNSDPLFTLALCCFGEDNVGGAIEAFEKAKTVEPDHPYVSYYSLHSNFLNAIKHEDMGLAHRTVIQFEELLKRQNAPAYGHFIACRIYSAMQNMELAIAELNKALIINPDYVDAIYLKSLLDVDPLTVQSPEGMKAYMDKVEEAMTSLVNIDPNFAEPYKLLAKIHVDKKDFTKALECYEKAMSLTRRPTELLMTMGEYVMAEARREAVVYVEKISE